MPLSDRVRQIIDQNAPFELRGYLYRMAEKESSGNPNLTHPGGASGLFQFIPSTGRTYGLVGSQGDLRKDPVANTRAMVKLTLDNNAILQKSLGRQPSYSELAVAHQQGAGTAAKMLTGTGNASRSNLESNQGYAATGPEAAAKIMNYYGFDKKPPGLTLASSPFPQEVPPGAPIPGAGMPTTTPVPYINPSVGTGVASPPAAPPDPTGGYGGTVGLGGGVNMVTPQGAAPIVPGPVPGQVPVPDAPQAPQGIMDQLAGALKDKDGKASDLSSGLDTIAKGISPKAAPPQIPNLLAGAPEANQSNQMAAQLMMAMMNRPRGLTLTGR